MGYGPRDHEESDMTGGLTRSLSNKGRQAGSYTHNSAGEI